MSLVAYASSDDDSDCEDNTANTSAPILLPKPIASTSAASASTSHKQIAGTADDIDDDDDIPRNVGDLKLDLPQPKARQTRVIEEDDEFLHKKVAPALIEKFVPQKPKVPVRKPVRITIPSLADFDDDPAMAPKKPSSVGPQPNKASGLLDRLPPPRTFKRAEEPSLANTKPKAAATVTSLIPHTVANRNKGAQAAQPKPGASSKESSLGLAYKSDDSDAEEDSAGDFFSLNNESKLPEVSLGEIKAMVSKRADKMAQFSKQLDQSQRMQTEEEEAASMEPVAAPKQSLRDRYDLEALMGTRAAKRARTDDIQFIEISQDEVAASKDEWMRTSLQAETEPEQRGPLPGAPGAGTKKKHQITYLAYQAKANEQELQAMWANNRQSRRQTQSKYGF